MSCIGYEPQRETIKYRCPEEHGGWECPMSSICDAGKKYGLGDGPALGSHLESDATHAEIHADCTCAVRQSESGDGGLVNGVGAKAASVRCV